MPTAEMTVNPEEGLQVFEALLRKASPIFADIIGRNRERFGPSWASRFMSDLQTMYGPPNSQAWIDAIWGYVEFSMDGLRFQHFLEKHGRYRYERFSEVQKAYLEDEAHMLKNYLPGMVISHYLWPHHYGMGQTYSGTFLPRVDREIQPATFVEVGTGSAMYTLHTLRGLPGIRGAGYDISPHSVSFGNVLLKSFGLADRCTIIQRDGFKHQSDRPVDFVLSQEVLEHLEDPKRFVANLYGLVRSGGMGYITAAVTAGHSDHIYLFRSPDEVESLIRSVGFHVVDSTVEKAYDGKVKNLTPRIAGYLVRKD